MKSAPDRLKHTLSLSINCVPARLLSGGINRYDHYWIGYDDRTIKPSDISPLADTVPVSVTTPRINGRCAPPTQRSPWVLPGAPPAAESNDSIDLIWSCCGIIPLVHQEPVVYADTDCPFGDAGANFKGKPTLGSIHRGCSGQLIPDSKSRGVLKILCQFFNMQCSAARRIDNKLHSNKLHRDTHPQVPRDSLKNRGYDYLRGHPLCDCAARMRLSV
jgi:hypothetical protein